MAADEGLEEGPIPCIKCAAPALLLQCAKLTADVVRAIRAQHAQGHKQIEIAREFGLSAQSVNDVVQRKTWRHLED